MLAVGLDALDEVLDHLVVDLVAEDGVVLEDGADCPRLQLAVVEEQLEVLVQQHLVVLVSETEVLQELVGEPHQLVHPHVLLGVKRDLQQVQHNLGNRNIKY